MAETTCQGWVVGSAKVTLIQLQQSGASWLKTAGAVVERSQVIVEIHVQILTARCFGATPGVIDESGTDVLAPCCDRDHGVLQPCMDKAIPEDVDEADEVGTVARYDPAEAVPVNELDPIPL